MLWSVNSISFTHRIQIGNKADEADQSLEVGTELETIVDDITEDSTVSGTISDDSNDENQENISEFEIQEAIDSETEEAESIIVDDDELIIYRTDSTTEESEVNSITLNNEDMEELIREEYKNLRKYFYYSELTINLADNNKEFEFTITSNDGEASVKDAKSFFEFDNLLNDINELFTVSTLYVNDFNCVYYTDEELTKVLSMNCSSSYTPDDGFYKVEASKLTMNEIVIVSPDRLDLEEDSDDLYYFATKELVNQDYSDVTHLIIYSGNMEYDISSDMISGETVGMEDTNVPFLMYKTSETIKQYETENPNFKWFQVPTEGQMTLNLLLDTFDQNRNEDSNDISPPRGLSSINKLGLRQASFYSESGKISSIIVAEVVVPDFDFLPLGMTTYNNVAYIEYENVSSSTVFIEGSIDFVSENTFITYFNKYSDTNEYTITLSGREGAFITFEDIKEDIFPTLSMNTDTILPDQDYALESLATFNIYENNSVIYEPTIEIMLEPYLLYEITGKMRSGMEKGKLHTK
jgi:hypothetical protein